MVAVVVDFAVVAGVVVRIVVDVAAGSVEAVVPRPCRVAESDAFRCTLCTLCSLLLGSLSPYGPLRNI